MPLGQVLGTLSSEVVVVVGSAGVAAGVGGIGSLLWRATSKSSLHVVHAAIMHASSPLRRSSSGKWIFFSGVLKVISFANLSVHSLILSLSAKNMAKLFLVRIPAQSRYSRRGLSSGMPALVSVSFSSACILAMCHLNDSGWQGLSRIKLRYHPCKTGKMGGVDHVCSETRTHEQNCVSLKSFIKFKHEMCSCIILSGEMFSQWPLLGEFVLGRSPVVVVINSSEAFSTQWVGRFGKGFLVLGGAIVPST